MSSMSAPFGSLPPLAVIAGIAALLVLVGIIGVTLSERSLAKGARRDGRVPAGRAAGAVRARAVLGAGAQHSASGLSVHDIARLNAFRARARLMAGEPLQRPSAWQKIQFAWRDGYAGWIASACIGAFAMSLHFGAFWLVVGGTWLGAIAVSLLATAAMVGLCAWIGLGLISTR